MQPTTHEIYHIRSLHSTYLSSEINISYKSKNKPSVFGHRSTLFFPFTSNTNLTNLCKKDSIVLGHRKNVRA